MFNRASRIFILLVLSSVGLLIRKIQALKIKAENHVTYFSYAEPIFARGCVENYSVHGHTS